jgi:predicted transcriptional regulator
MCSMSTAVLPTPNTDRLTSCRLLMLYVVCYKNNMSLKGGPAALTKRERQIMDVMYRLGRATVSDVIEQLEGSPGYSTVRTQLGVLERKGHLRHEEEGLRYVYMPTVPRHSARRSALRHLVDTFFEGSAAKTVAALLGGEASRISDEELKRIEELVKSAHVERNQQGMEGATGGEPAGRSRDPVLGNARRGPSPQRRTRQALRRTAASGARHYPARGRRCRAFQFPWA